MEGRDLPPSIFKQCHQCIPPLFAERTAHLRPRTSRRAPSVERRALSSSLRQLHPLPHRSTAVRPTSADAIGLRGELGEPQAGAEAARREGVAGGSALGSLPEIDDIEAPPAKDDSRDRQLMQQQPRSEGED